MTETVSQEAQQVTVTQADEVKALEVFADVLGDMGSFAEFGRPSYQDGALRTIAVHLARHRHRQSAERETLARAAHAQGEPVAWMYEKTFKELGHHRVVGQKRDTYAVAKGWTEPPLYAHPQPSADLVEAFTQAATAALWPILGGNHTDADTWGEIEAAIAAALAKAGAA